MHKFLLFFWVLLPTISHSQPVVNVYVWGGEIPQQIVYKFQQATGIRVNFSTYDNNETMYAKLKASHKNRYDVILPSAYFVERMKNQGMLQELNHAFLPNLSNLAAEFQNNDFDHGNKYSVPLIWGATGIFYNKNLTQNIPHQWQDLWSKVWRKQLLLLNDAREIFSMALLSLGYNPNDQDKEHIAAAFQHLVELTPNIKLFASDSVQALMIDEDAVAGTAWNGDALKVQKENPEVAFSYPEDGFVIWVDCLAIPKDAPHLKEAYAFINFLLRPQISKIITEEEGHAITNAKGRKLLAPWLRDNFLLYPPADILKRGYFQRDVGEETLELYNNYWQKLKLSF